MAFLQLLLIQQDILIIALRLQLPQASTWIYSQFTFGPEGGQHGLHGW